jgi:hypothetical protein
VGVPDPLKLGSELWQFRWIGAPFDARFKAADWNRQSTRWRWRSKACSTHVCVMSPFPVFSNSSVAAKAQHIILVNPYS